MATSVAEPRRAGLPQFGNWPKSAFFTIIGLLAMAIPTIISMGSNYWSTEDGVHGPIIFATGLWLIWREREWLLAEARPMRGWLWAIPLFLLGLLWVFARTFGVESVESASLYLIFVLAGIVYFGPRAMRRMWFPVLYMAFLIVPPGSLIVELTQPMKIYISSAAVEVLYFFGYPVAHTGAVIQVGQYQLLVATACAGLMSLFSLTAIGMLYVHLSWNSNIKRAVILLLAIVPIAVFANFMRVITLVLLTYHAGSAVAQGIMHDMAGLITFSISLLAMFAVDKFLSIFFTNEAAA